MSQSSQCFLSYSSRYSRLYQSIIKMETRTFCELPRSLNSLFVWWMTCRNIWLIQLTDVICSGRMMNMLSGTSQLCLWCFLSGFNNTGGFLRLILSKLLAESFIVWVWQTLLTYTYHPCTHKLTYTHTHEWDKTVFGSCLIIYNLPFKWRKRNIGVVFCYLVPDSL